MTWGNGSYDMGWGSWVMMVMMIIFWFGLIALIIAAFSGARFGRRPSSRESDVQGDRALNVLRERFARGEITVEEYETVRRTLADDA